MSEAAREPFGRLLARSLSGAWRGEPSAVDFSQVELQKVTPHLLRSGAAPLGWRRVRDSVLQESAAALSLRQAYRLTTLRSMISDSRIKTVFQLLRSADVEPILIKGWGVAQYYPERGLRPYGDIDVCVRADQYRTAASALAGLPRRQYRVDLHQGFEKFGDENFEELFSRSQLERLDEVDVRVPSREDHFRLVCFHLLREGAWRPLWLCDVAAMLEARQADFDWKLCLNSKRGTQAVACAVALAHSLFEANTSDIPDAARLKQFPDWLIRTVMSEWDSLVPSMSHRHSRPMLMHLRRPTRLLQALRHRWPNPIEATITMKGRINEWPRLPLQIGNCLYRTKAFLLRLPSEWRDQLSHLCL